MEQMLSESVGRGGFPGISVEPVVLPHPLCYLGLVVPPPLLGQG
jgi:hypothetical protein